MVCFLSAGFHFLRRLYGSQGGPSPSWVSFGRSRDRGLAVGAVAGLGGGEYYLAEEISAIVVRTFQKDLPEIQIIPLHEARTNLAATDYKKFLGDFSETTAIEERDFDLFQPIQARARYVMLLNIGMDRDHRLEMASERTIDQQVKNPKTGKLESKYDYTEYEAWRNESRDMQITMIILDLESRKPVWMAIGSDGLQANRSSTSTTAQPGYPAWPGSPGRIKIIHQIVHNAVGKIPR